MKLENSLQIDRKKKELLSLIAVNVLLVTGAILFYIFGLFPLSWGDFMFFAALVLLGALYRPRWAFWLFLGTLPLEIIFLAPAEIGFQLRFYQLFGVAALMGYLLRYCVSNNIFHGARVLASRLHWLDMVVAAMVAGSFLALIDPVDVRESFRLSVVLVSFYVLYLTTRLYVSKKEHLRDILPFIISSFFVVGLFSIWQNWQFLHGGIHFEAMPGRPNGTFPEADWLGMYASVIIAFALSLYLVLMRSPTHTSRKKILGQIAIWNFLVLALIVLILTVARSAWLAAGVVFGIFILRTLFGLDQKKRIVVSGKSFTHALSFTVSAFGLAMAFVLLVPLTNFELGNRLQSTGTGKQEITISCSPGISAPTSIERIEDLRSTGCRHINLEEMSSERERGNTVLKIYRDDPNVSTRLDIWKESWKHISERPILGLGWGGISNYLGEDARGAQLNASNIFLEIWLGSGLLGFLSVVLLFLYILIKGFLWMWRTDQYFWKGAVLVLTGIALIVANLFNSGQFLGFFWVWLALSVALIHQIKNT